MQVGGILGLGKRELKADEPGHVEAGAAALVRPGCAGGWRGACRVGVFHAARLAAALVPLQAAILSGEQDEQVGSLPLRQLRSCYCCCHRRWAPPPAIVAAATAAGRAQRQMQARSEKHSFTKPLSSHLPARSPTCCCWMSRRSASALQCVSGSGWAAAVAQAGRLHHGRAPPGGVPATGGCGGWRDEVGPTHAARLAGTSLPAPQLP